VPGSARVLAWARIAHAMYLLPLSRACQALHCIRSTQRLRLRRGHATPYKCGVCRDLLHMHACPWHPMHLLLVESDTCAPTTAHVNRVPSLARTRS
jgi:hypothetical protein